MVRGNEIGVGGMEVAGGTKEWLAGLKLMELFPKCRLEWLYAFPYIINSHVHKGVNFCLFHFVV